MGSLVAGWDGEGSKGLERAGSFTKDEISAFWEKKKKLEERQQEKMRRHLKLLQDEEGVQVEEQQSPKSPVFETAHEEERFNDWWRRSNSAYLNEPPLLEDFKTAMSMPYCSQFDVAEKHDSHGVHAH